MCFLPENIHLKILPPGRHFLFEPPPSPTPLEIPVYLHTSLIKCTALKTSLPFGIFSNLLREKCSVWIFPWNQTILHDCVTTGILLLELMINGKERWHSGDIACLPPAWPEFESQRWCHICSGGFSPGSLVFLPPQKPTLLIIPVWSEVDLSLWICQCKFLFIFIISGTLFAIAYIF